MYSIRRNLYAFAYPRLDWDLASRRGLRARQARSLIKRVSCFLFFFFVGGFVLASLGLFSSTFYFSTSLLLSPYLGSREDLLLVVLVDALLDLLHSV